MSKIGMIFGTFISIVFYVLMWQVADRGLAFSTVGCWSLTAIGLFTVLFSSKTVELRKSTE